MASTSISASFQRACSSYHVTKKQQFSAKSVQSIGTTQANPVVTLDVEGQKGYNIAEQQKEQTRDGNGETKPSSNTESSAHKFSDERWKKGTWDLNMFVKNGKMDWDGVIVAESGRRRFLELYPEASTNDEPVLFRSSIIPWWAWLQRSYLPEAELLNGRAAMVGFFMAYLVDGLTGLDVVGQTGNFICKAGLFVTVISIVLFRKAEDFRNLKNLADEATLYDKQWQSSWQDQNAASNQTGKNM